MERTERLERLDTKVKHLVITMSDENYFPNGRHLIKTRDRVDADFILYTPTDNGLSVCSKKICEKNNIQVKDVLQTVWNNMNQSLLFYYFSWHYRDYDYVTYCDFDTLFVNNWANNVFCHDFTLGITTTQGYPQWDYIRSRANGGVVFLRNRSDTKKFLDFAKKCIMDGGHPSLPQYDQIWKTLEDPNRKESKRHFRNNYAWWCDQVLLSALVINPIFKIKTFPCKFYNVLNSKPDITVEPGVYIKHLKSGNRPVKGLICG